MALTLCPRVEDGWQFDFVEDLALTPTPRDEVDWTQLPIEAVNVIMQFYYELQANYWAEITEQKSYDCLKGVVKPQEVPIIEYHMNKRLTINLFKSLQSKRKYEVGRDPLEDFNAGIQAFGYVDANGNYVQVQGPPQPDLWTQEKADKGRPGGHREVSTFLMFHKDDVKPYKVKTIKNKKGQIKNKGRQSTRVCSLCGKVGHNKNNRKFHP